MMNNFKGSGIITSTPKLFYIKGDKKFFIFNLSIKRDSENIDTLPIVSNIDCLAEGQCVSIIGSYRSYNKKVTANKSKLVLTVLADEVIIEGDNLNINELNLEGYIVKEPIFRTTPLGREICDLLIACNREQSKLSDYLPCIAWGKTAKYSSKLKVGDKIILNGRVQSRAYQKEDKPKIAYEISIKNLTKAL